MTRYFHKSALAIAVAAVVAAPAAMAQAGSEGSKSSNRTTSDYSESNRTSNTEIDISKDLNTRKDVNYDIRGTLRADSLGMAVINNEQDTTNNVGLNDNNNNNASIGDNAMRRSSGNIGANAAAGDNNTQSNAAALATADAGFVFGHADAEVFAEQDGQENVTENAGVRNRARLNGNALRGASGNIGVNVASGNSNAQQNNLSASVGGGSFGEANVAMKQSANHNLTTNVPGEVVTENSTTEDISLSMSDVGGTYWGDVDQSNNVYPDNWAAPDDVDPHDQHGSGPFTTGHSDFDSQTETSDSDGDNAPLDDDGAFEFEEEGDLALRGTATGSATFSHVERRRSSNRASIGGNALMDASGNIAVNSAAGTNNLQANSLSIAAGRQNGGGDGGSVE